ncbi:hypothetical protein LEP1GSC051_0921 [Leptospira sp. P2653]|nr:hypothetical protein LEP1GSC051_0921 [Leptospira sp. P2653]
MESLPWTDGFFEFRNVRISELDSQSSYRLRFKNNQEENSQV